MNIQGYLLISRPGNDLSVKSKGISSSKGLARDPPPPLFMSNFYYFQITTSTSEASFASPFLNFNPSQLTSLGVWMKRRMRFDRLMTNGCILKTKAAFRQLA